MLSFLRSGALVLLLSPACAFAQLTSYHFWGPVDAMHDLPVGESPGWSQNNWVNFEVGLSNVWNHSFTMTDSRNGNVYGFFADYEQETAIAEIGRALTSSLAVAVEVPYTNHNGGFTDQAVDQYHQLIGSDRFERDVSPMFGNHLQIQTNGVNELASEHAEGVGNLKGKIKYWLWHWKSAVPGACDCGLAFSAQVKVPTQTAAHGLSSGHSDYSELVHFGVPLGGGSGMWATAAFTELGTNDDFPGWPMNPLQQMYELHFDLEMGPHVGLIMTGRYESPLFDKQYLSFNYTQPTASGQIEERTASGWNALVEWRGSEDIGVRWRWGGGNQFAVMFVEDWGIGNQDQTRDGFYINDAPDFMIVTQWHLVF